MRWAVGYGGIGPDGNVLNCWAGRWAERNGCAVEKFPMPRAHGVVSGRLRRTQGSE